MYERTTVFVRGSGGLMRATGSAARLNATASVKAARSSSLCASLRIFAVTRAAAAQARGSSKRRRPQQDLSLYMCLPMLSWVARFEVHPASVTLSSSRHHCRLLHRSGLGCSLAAGPFLQSFLLEALAFSRQLERTFLLAQSPLGGIRLRLRRLHVFRVLQ